jgi:hypothetical protein
MVMRTSLASLALCLFMAAGAQAQVWSGANPRPINFSQVNTNKMAQPRNVSSAFKSPTQHQPFSLTNIFHPFSLPSWPPKHGVAVPPTAAQLQMFQQQQTPQPTAVSQFFQPMRYFLSPY